MTLRKDGRYRCDRCGHELENGGVHECAVVADLVEGRSITFHFCRENGCDRKVLSNRNLSDYRTQEGTP